MEQGTSLSALILRSGRRPRLEGWRQTPEHVAILRDARCSRSSGWGSSAALGFEPSGMTSAELDATIKAEIAKWRKVIETRGLPRF